MQNGTLPESTTTHACDAGLPASSVKPKYKDKPTLLKWRTGSARTFRGPVVLGIRVGSQTAHQETDAIVGRGGSRTAPTKTI
jgi:hypothetical protein